MSREGQHSWFKAEEEVVLEILVSQYKKLVEHVIENMEKYKRCIQTAFDVGKEFQWKGSYERHLLNVAAGFALIENHELEKLIALYNYEKPPSRHEKLRDTVRDLRICVGEGEFIAHDNTARKVVFLLFSWDKNRKNIIYEENNMGNYFSH